MVRLFHAPHIKDKIMLGNFTYCNPTKLYFGQNALDGLNEELPKYGKNVLLVYGGGSIKKNGIYDKVVEILKANGKEVYEDAGVMLVGIGSEMNGGSVITNHEQKLKIGHVFGENVVPKFSILNPKFTYTLPKYQMVSGIYDIMSHILEQYFSGTDDNTSDYIMEGLLRSLIHSADIAVENPTHCGKIKRGHVDSDMGAQYPCSQRKNYRLDGTYAGTGSSCPYGRHTRHDACGCFYAVLPLYPSLRNGKVCPLCRERMECKS